MDLFFLSVCVNCSRELNDKEKRIRQGTERKACSKFAVLPQPPSRVNTTERLIKLRKIMSQPTQIADILGLQAVVVTTDDEHQVNGFICVSVLSSAI